MIYSPFIVRLNTHFQEAQAPLVMLYYFDDTLKASPVHVTTLSLTINM